MANFTNYTEKTEPVDTDLALIYDTPAKANKKLTFGNLWKWIAKKIVSEGISQLDTTNKTIPGAINELNSKSLTYLKSNRSSTAPVTFNIDSYKTYIIFVNHDGGNNSVVSLIYAESNPKLIELYRVGAVFTINLKNKTLAITSSTTYWNYTIIYV